MIANGELQPGDQLLPERELVAKLKVSRPSLRTGIAYLSSVGMLEIRHGSGTFVAADLPAIQFNPPPMRSGRECSQLWEARRLLETSIAELAAERGGSKQIAEMAEQLIEIYAALDDSEQYFIHEVLFHRAMARGIGNRFLSAILDATISSDSHGISAARRAQDLRNSAELHRKIYLSIRAHDPSQARLLMEEYLEAAVHSAQPEVHSQLQEIGKTAGKPIEPADSCTAEEENSGAELDRLAS